MEFLSSTDNVHREDVLQYGPDPDELLRFRLHLDDVSGTGFLDTVFDHDPSPAAIGIVTKNFRKGVDMAVALAERILAGHKFEWWDLEGYAKQANEVDDWVCSGQMMRILGKYNLERVAGWGPLLVASQPLLFPDGSNYFLDALTNATTTNFGQGYPLHVAAANAILEKTGGVNSQVYHPDVLFKEVAKGLMKLAPGEGKVGFYTSGGDANSAAISYSRQFVQFAKQLPDNAPMTTVFFEEAYHGNVETGMAGLCTSGLREKMGQAQSESSSLVFPFRDDQVDGQLARLREYISKGPIQCIIFETTQGDGGGVSMHPRFFVEMLKLSIDHDIPLVDDEIQCGWHRTFGLWGISSYLEDWGRSKYVTDQGYNPRPDLICIALGKSITNGVIPGSAVLVPERISQHIERAQGLQSYTGHPQKLAAVLAQCSMMSAFSGVLQETVARKRQLFDATLAPFRDEPESIVGETSGHGLHVFVEIKGEKNNQAVGAELLGRYRVMSGTVSRGRIRIHAPINAPDIVWKAIAHAIGCAACDIVQHGPSPNTLKIMQAGTSGFAERYIDSA